jgi:hypothetical protein
MKIDMELLEQMQNEDGQPHLVYNGRILGIFSICSVKVNKGDVRDRAQVVTIELAGNADKSKAEIEAAKGQIEKDIDESPFF